MPQNPWEIEVGSLRHRVLIQQASSTRDAAGQLVQTWNTVRTTFAKIEGTSSRSFRDSFSNNALAAQSTDLVTVRWTPLNLEPDMRVAFGGRMYLIQGVDNVQRRNRKVLLACIVIDEGSN